MTGKQTLGIFGAVVLAFGLLFSAAAAHAATPGPTYVASHANVNMYFGVSESQNGLRPNDTTTVWTGKKWRKSTKFGTILVDDTGVHLQLTRDEQLLQVDADYGSGSSTILVGNVHWNGKGTLPWNKTVKGSKKPLSLEDVIVLVHSSRLPKLPPGGGDKLAGRKLFTGFRPPRLFPPHYPNSFHTLIIYFGRHASTANKYAMLVRKGPLILHGNSNKNQKRIGSSRRTI